jgi:hypothetical protein
MDNEYEIFVKDFSECFNEISLSLLNPNSGKKSLQVKSLLNINEKNPYPKVIFPKTRKNGITLSFDYGSKKSLSFKFFSSGEKRRIGLILDYAMILFYFKKAVNQIGSSYIAHKCNIEESKVVNPNSLTLQELLIIKTEFHAHFPDENFFNYRLD